MEEEEEEAIIVTVSDLLKHPLAKKSYEEKLLIVQSKKPKPELKNLSTVCKTNKRSTYIRHFSISYYQTVEWLTGCEEKNKLFCWPCLLFPNESGVWNKSGFCDLNHFSEATKKHGRSEGHKLSFLQFRIFGTQRIETVF